MSSTGLFCAPRSLALLSPLDVEAPNIGVRACTTLALQGMLAAIACIKPQLAISKTTNAEDVALPGQWCLVQYQIWA